MEYDHGCHVVSGQWHSWYDDVTTTAASDLDIDHVVPLQEAWGSGAYAWTPEVREAYANDLEFAHGLEAVTAGSNRSKGSRDPEQWLPPDSSQHCQYATYWVEIKYRWSLTIDPGEHDTLALLLQGSCGSTTVAVPTVMVGPPSFSDVGPGNQFQDDIAWLASTGITTGWPDGTFRPKESITREAMAAFIHRLAGNTPYNGDDGFSDVSPGNQFQNDIAWLATTGITTGWPDGTFRPKESITREAMAAFIHRLAGNTPYNGDDGFSDVSPGNQFQNDIAWLATTGITTGWPDGTFRPKEPITREAVAAFVHRFATSSVGCLGESCSLDTSGNSRRPANPGDVKSCGDFSTWKQADAWFQKYYEYYGDVAHLDGDSNGVSCERLPGSPISHNTTPSKPANPGDVKNCGDFSTWKKANAWYQKYYKHYGDVARLDGDNNGVPCESLPGAP